MQPVTCVVSNLEIHSQHPSDDDQHNLKYSSRHLEIHCHHHRSDDYRHILAIALNIKLYTLMISCPHPHRHPDDQHNLMGNRHDDQTLHCASFHPSTLIINSCPHPLIIITLCDQHHLRSCNSASSKATLAYCLYQLVTWFCAIFCSKFFFCAFANHAHILTPSSSL